MIPQPKPAERLVSQRAGTEPGPPAASPVAASQAHNLPREPWLRECSSNPQFQFPIERHLLGPS